MISDSELIVNARRIINNLSYNPFVTRDMIADRLKTELNIDEQKALNIMYLIFN